MTSTVTIRVLMKFEVCNMEVVQWSLMVQQTRMRIIQNDLLPVHLRHVVLL